ncbi:MAG: hypothetical protein ACI379_08735 [Nocardioides sp.]|uniref:hypothetical protein n=1 Tax=Nocardioides sp. TaxID=35761 RepID=UPI003F078138
MAASRSARQRKAQTDAGPLAVVSITVGADDQFVYKIHCTACTSPRPGSGDRAWGTHRRGEDNGYMAAMDRWILHLVDRHPGTDAPCLAYLPEAQQRLHERRTRASS